MTIETLKQVVRSIRNRPLRKWCREDDLPAYADVVARYRMRGAKIGKFVRLLGSIDGVNPQLISVGDYSVIGAVLHSSLIALSVGPHHAQSAVLFTSDLARLFCPA
jgi:hypothetical protein